MTEENPLTALSEAQRAQALERFTIIRPALEDGISPAQVARTSKKSPSTIRDWIKRYREKGLAGLANHISRSNSSNKEIPRILEDTARGGMRYSAYHGDAGFKQTVIRLLTHLSEVGLISHGTANDKGVGAAVLMVMEDSRWCDDPIKDFCKMLGFPEWIGQLYNLVYECLPEGGGNQWDVEFMRAIPVGCDLDELKLPFYRGLLADKEIGIRSACGSDVRAGAFIGNLLDGLGRCHDPKDLRALSSRLEQERDEATRTADPFEDEELRPTGALYCADWIMLDLPTSAVPMAVSARVGCLSHTATWWHILRHGQEDLVAAITTVIGGNGFALRSDREAQYQRVAEFLVKEVSHLRSSAVATASAEEIRWHRSTLRKVDESQLNSTIGGY